MTVITIAAASNTLATIAAMFGRMKLGMMREKSLCHVVLSDSPMKFSPVARWKRRHGNAAPWISSISVQSAITARLPAPRRSHITATPRARIGIRTTT